MHPSPMVLNHGKRLSIEEFGASFREAWSRSRSRILKLECWQAYQEQPHNVSQRAYQRGDIEEARALLAQEAEKDRPLYQDIAARGLDYARIRVVQEPLTDYLAYEAMSYRIRASMGESIFIVVVDDRIRLPNAELFDLLLFDRHTALVHDYGLGEVGAQTGGWLVRDEQTIKLLEESALSARSRAVPLAQYVAS
jgi:hypothetical protein